jgi:ribonuclease HI
VAKNKFYAYIIENTSETGIFDSWGKCQEKVKGKKARYKGFPTEREAKTWLNEGANYNKKSTKFYACFFTHSNDGVIVNSWDQCKELIKGGNVRYKSFKTEKEARKWLDNGGVYQTKEMIQSNLPDGIYFDAGTGRGIGTEVRVTDKYGNSILEKFIPKEKINEFGNFLTKDGSTNNFGELLGCYIALNIALKEGIKNIYGDSKLIIDYWSLGRIKKDNVNEKTFQLAQKVAKLRKEFEKLGGKILHVSGDINPADLGFHK